MQPHEQDPSAAAWLIAFVSLLLPWVGIGAGLFGAWTAGRGDATGWWMVAAGCALLAADIIIDFVWAHPSISRSDQPDLNHRAAQFVGRICALEEAIEGGRGKVRVGDTVWPAEGPEAAAGTRVKVTAVRSGLLLVEPA